MRRVVITGATKGIGQAVAEAFCDAEVLGVARSHANLNADVSTPVGRAAIAEAASRWGKLDLLVHNVGTNVRAPTAEFAPADYEHIMATNATSAFELARLLHPLLAKGTRPNIVFLSSVAAARAVRTSSAAYAMSKGAIEGLTRFLASEWGPAGIRVNTVAPWYVRTPLVSSVLEDEAKHAAILARTPLGRVGEPHEVAHAVRFLDEAAWVTGVVLPVDGGFMALGS